MRALIFELHGPLADDRLQRARALVELAAESSIELADREALAAARVDDVRAIQRVFTGAGRALTEDGLRRRLTELDERVGPAPLRPGARELVEMAAANVPVGVIAGSLQARASRLLKDADLFRRLVALVSAEAAAIPSAPALTLCLHRMNEALERWRIQPLAPGRTLVITDSEEGILAARQARMKVLAIAHGSSSASLQEADRVVDRLESIDLGEIAGALF